MIMCYQCILNALKIICDEVKYYFFNNNEIIVIFCGHFSATMKIVLFLDLSYGMKI